MEPVLMPAPAIMEGPAKPVVIRPPEVHAAHDFALLAWILVLIYSIPWFAVVLTIGLFGLLASPFLPFPLVLPPTLPVWLTSIPFIGPILIILTFPGVGLPASWFVYLGVGALGLLVGLIFLGVVYFSTVRNINKGRYEKARGWTLLWAILFFIPVFLVAVAPAAFFPTVLLLLPAFFFFMAYARLSEVVAKYGPIAVLGEAVPNMGMGMGMGMGGPPIAPMPPPMPPMMGPPPMMGGPPPLPPEGMPGPSPPQQKTPPICPTCGRELYYSANHRRWYCQKCDNPSGLR